MLLAGASFGNEKQLQKQPITIIHLLSAVFYQ